MAEPRKAAGSLAQVNITAWDRAHGVTTQEQKERALERARTSRERKKEREREKILRNMEGLTPTFGLSGSTHRAMPFDMQERDGGVAVLPDGSKVRIDETVSPFLKRPIYNVRYHPERGGGKFQSLSFDNEDDAVAAQRELYNKKLEAIKKKYNI